MGRHYSTRDFFRQMPNQLLARHFAARGVLAGLDFAALKEAQPEELFTAWLELPENLRNRVRYLREVKLWGNDDPLFPATRIALGATRQFEAAGLEREHWSSAERIRKVFREAFQRAGLPYFHPHSLRKTLSRLGEEVFKSPEDFKAWSQNLGHENVLTTLMSYGKVATDRQGEIIREIDIPKPSTQPAVEDLAANQPVPHDLRSA
jgi:hypothetical protein